MTWYASRIIRLHCDACHNQTEFTGRTVKDAQSWARDAGWSFSKEKRCLCPDCKPQRLTKHPTIIRAASRNVPNYPYSIWEWDHKKGAYKEISLTLTLSTAQELLYQYVKTGRLPLPARA